MQRKRAYPELFQGACQLLNGEKQVRRARGCRLPPDFVGPWIAWRAGLEAAEDEAPRLGLETLTRQDVEDLKDRVRLDLRYGRARLLALPAITDAFLDYSLPSPPCLPGAWPRPTHTQLEAFTRAEERMRPYWSLVLSLTGGLGIDGVDFLASRGLPPDTLERAYLCLLGACTLQAIQLSKERVIPCLACSRFFVATRATAETCSPACRQRLCQSRLPPERKHEVRRMRTEYMRRYRQSRGSQRPL